MVLPSGVGYRIYELAIESLPILAPYLYEFPYTDLLLNFGVDRVFLLSEGRQNRTSR